MSHPAQLNFCHDVKQRFSDFFSGVRVLEVGARNINGSFREEFQNCDYVGVDCCAGDGVDVVCLGHEFQAEPGSFDVVYSAETFEHDPYAEKTVARMSHLLRPGGLFFMTCAGSGRAEHGTSRTGKRYGPDAHYYQNVTMRQFLQWIHADQCKFDEIFIKHDRETCDLYFYGVKSGS